ncbi:ATP-binding protein [Giardia muris]|uniref:GPN-loop GTPase n=1 Tax=Giardia muris TaxID=5742 RepID=A0A4Z1T9A8_GIAMU|nr:ATP-binding protein [Giardia muris]|eukprot:TNJ30723.1 ATP-binding protein [Giardia muris]
MDLIPEMYRRPPAFFVIGMAGAGKTTFVQRLAAEIGLETTSYAIRPRISADVIPKRPAVINLDPAVMNVPYTPVVDIRDSFSIGDLMKRHGWGPNGAIMTCLNLFATRIDELDTLLRRRAERSSCFLFDTPGQVEVFTWSASGEIIANFFGAAYPTALLYVLDSERCANPVTFVASMMYCCSIIQRMSLPLLIVFNKDDLVGPDLREGGHELSWRAPWVYMEDETVLCEAFDALRIANVNEIAYSESFYDSLRDVLQEFYSLINYIHVSSFTGENFHSLTERLRAMCVRYVEEAPERIRRAEQAKVKARTQVRNDPLGLFSDRPTTTDSSDDPDAIE